MTNIDQNTSNRKPLLDTALSGHLVGDYLVTLRQSGCFFYLIHAIAKNDGADVRLTHHELSSLLSCSSRNITKIITRLELLELITVNRVISLKDNAPVTRNYYNIHWKRAYELLGNKIYGYACDWKHKFIAIQLNKIRLRLMDAKNAMLSTCRNLVHSFYSYNTDTYTYPDEENKDKKGRVLKKGDPPPDRMPVYPADTQKTQPSHDRKDSPMSEACLFPAHYVTCPHEWRVIANELCLKENLIEAEFTYMRNFWLYKGDDSSAKRINWDDIWRAWIKRLRNNPKLCFKFTDKEPMNISPSKNTPDERTKRFAWKERTYLPSKWRSYIEKHGGFENRIENMNMKFNCYYLARPEIKRTEDEWYVLWMQWVDRRPRIDVSTADDTALSVSIPSEGSIEHKIYKMVGAAPYESYFKTSIITPIENDALYRYELRFRLPCPNKSKYGILLQDIGIYVC